MLQDGARGFVKVANKRRWAIKQAADGWQIKRADGDGNDMPFEQAMASMAHDVLADKAPALFEYEVGFQLLDRNDDNSKAVGVFGFKVGPQILLAPVFFIDGDLKGTDLLYMSNQDLFIPLRENWINALRNKKPLILGDGISRNLSQLNIRQPDFYRFNNPPSKFAAALPPWLLPSMPGLASAAIDSPMRPVPGLVEKLAGANGVKLAGLALGLLEAYPTLGGLFDDAYGDGLARKLAALRPGLEKAAAEAEANPLLRNRLLPTGPLRVEKLAILTHERMLELGIEGGEHAEKLTKDGYAIVDKRADDEVARVFSPIVRAEQVLENPSRTGLYLTLTSGGDFKKCAIVLNPHGPKGRVEGALVISADGDGGRDWIFTSPSRVWVRGQLDDDAWREWVAKLPEADSGEGQAAYLLSDKPDGTLAFDQDRTFAETSGKVFTAYFTSYCASCPTGYTPVADWRLRTVSPDRILITPDRTYLSSRGGELLVPEKARRIALKPLGGGGSSSAAELLPANGEMGPSEVFYEKLAATTEPLSVRVRGGDVWIGENPPLSKRAALFALVRSHHLREDAALDVIKEAAESDRRGRGPALFRLMPPEKRAAGLMAAYGPGTLVEGAPEAPPIPEQIFAGGSIMSNWHPTAYPEEYNLAVPSIRTDPSEIERMRANAPVMNDPTARNLVSEAARTGQREVFDTSVLGVLLRASDDDQLVEDNLDDLVRGMDRLGRMLFQLYWHRDRFAERYGKDRLPVLESAFKSVFKDLGDLVLELKNRTIHADPTKLLRRTELDDKDEE